MADKHKHTGFPIVGIGASAGGLNALEDFLKHAPADGNMAYVLVPHLDPTHDSMLVEILQRSTNMPVLQAEDQLLVKPNHVYIVPPNRDLAIFHAALQLTEPELPRGQRMPIDAFLRSLAEDQQENAVGVVLSGTGSDGTLGLRAILGAGGLTLVQEPATAKYEGMPNNAIKAGYASYVLPVEKMSEAILLGVRALTSEQPADHTSKTLGEINHILTQLRSLTGYDFSQYKESTTSRRIERRMSQLNIDDSDKYAHYLKTPGEAQALSKALLINVTNFFRDAEAFSTLQTEILRRLSQQHADNYVFRAWIAGCATGEEAYSIAILLRELTEQTPKSFKIQIYATDLNEETIAIARAGIYPLNIAQDVSPERLRRFFYKENAGYRIKKEIREMMVFASQNVTKDPPFTKLDLISCRNLLIYLKPEIQSQLIKTFHYALNPGGLLFLSPSENIGSHTGLFTLISRKWKIYNASDSFPFPRTLVSPFSKNKENMDQTSLEPNQPFKETNFAELTRRILMQHFAPSSVITDLKGDVLYIYGDTGKYLRPAPGHPSHNIIEMAREGLAAELSEAIWKTASNRTPTLQRQTQIKTGDTYAAIKFSVRPVPNPDDKQNLLLVSFEDVIDPSDNICETQNAAPVQLTRINQLEYELAHLRENYQTTVEELQATNEEMQATNEELQSTNEELETSKEELQSVNEELITVNSELHSKIAQLADMQNDMKNLLENINVGIIFLNQHLMIRSFTREAERIYRLVPSDVGRSLHDIKPVAGGDDLLVAAQTVLDSLVPYEHELQVDDETRMMVRIQPYLTLDNVIDGVVMAFTDITARIKAVALQETLMLAESIADTVHEPLVVLDDTLKVLAASSSFYREFQLTQGDTIGCPIQRLTNYPWENPTLCDVLEKIQHGNQIVNHYTLACELPITGRCTIQINARRTANKIGDSQLILLAIEIQR